MDSTLYFRNLLGEEFDLLHRYPNIEELLKDCCDKFKDYVAISFGDTEIKYEKLYEDVSLLRGYFTSLGFKKGDNVGLVFRNEYDFVRSFFALATLGICSAIIPVALPEQALFGLSQKFNLKGLVFTNDIKDKISKLKEMHLDLTYVSEDDLASYNGESLSSIKLSGQEPACIIFTGGTTGSPKGALLSHLNLCTGALNGVYVKDKTMHLRYMAIIPFVHIFGLVRNLLSCVMTGSNLYLVKEVPQFVKDIRKFKPQIMVLVPALANLIYSLVAQGGKAAVGGELDYIISGGANVPAELIQRLGTVGINCLPGYGLTETASLVSGNGDWKRIPSSVGCPYPNQELKVVDGELWVKGDHVFLGYYNDEAETNKVLENGWLKTGDLVKFDEDGFLYIVGRCKNILILDNGENVSPEIIENKLDNNPLILGSMAYEGVNDRGINCIAVKIFPNYPVLERKGLDPKLTIEHIVSELNKELPSYMRVGKVTLLTEDFKRSGAMKIIRNLN